MKEDMQLYLFNPDHDMSLANQDANYMPPASARKMASDLAILPVWYAEAGSYVLAPSAYNQIFLNDMRKHFPHLPTLMTESEVSGQPVTPHPWGWDPAVCKRLEQLGVDSNKLPDTQQLSDVRRLSHRSIAADMLHALKDMNKDFCGDPTVLTHINGLRVFVENNPRCMLKAPLSGSGKGLNRCKGVLTPQLTNWCNNILQQQHAVIGEPLFDKVLDFAMLFYAEASGEITFQGYSVFFTDGGAYEGNLLGSDAYLRQMIEQYVSGLDELQNMLQSLLKSTIAGHYTGYLGVDMMVCNVDGGFRIHPCVEINLRMTMGVVAHLFYRQHVVPGLQGDFRVAYYTSNQELMDQHRSLSRRFPLVISHDRIEKGYLPLIPLSSHTRYLTYVVVG